MSDGLANLNIPLPNKRLFGLNPYLTTLPAPELVDFMHETVLNETSFLFNLEHIHLTRAEIGFLFSSTANTRMGKQIIGTCEILTFRCGKWQKARQEQQIYEWFGYLPDFLITFDANFWLAQLEAGKPENILSLFEHELYHAGQARDMFGMPKFSRDTGKPMFALAPHSIEEHTGVVRRYGAAASGQDTVDFVEAAMMQPEIAPAQLKGLCGVCAN